MACPLRRRDLDRRVTIAPLRRGQKDRAGKGSGPGTYLDHLEVIGPAESLEFGLDPASENGTEQRTDFGRGEKVAAAAGATGDGVETVVAIESSGQKLVEPQRPSQGKEPARSVIAPTLAIRPGSTPSTSVETPQMTSAACIEPCTLMGLTSPSGTGFIHISRITVM